MKKQDYKDKKVLNFTHLVIKYLKKPVYFKAIALNGYVYSLWILEPMNTYDRIKAPAR